MRSFPCVGRTSVAAILRNVVLPAPFRPNNVRNSPRFTLSVRPLSAMKCPNVLRMSSDSSASVLAMGVRRQFRQRHSRYWRNSRPIALRPRTQFLEHLRQVKLEILQILLVFLLGDAARFLLCFQIRNLIKQLVLAADDFFPPLFPRARLSLQL